MKALAEEALGKAQRGEDLSNATKELADEALTALNEAKARLDEVEQKLARRVADDAIPEFKTIGEQVVADGAIKAFLGNNTVRGRASVEVKAIISALTTDANGSAGDLIVADRIPGIVIPGQRRLTVRDLLTPGRTASNSVQYVKETGYANAAATVSETSGPNKPQSDIKFDVLTSNVTTIAHWVLATRQILDDVPMLQSYIDGRLRYGLALIEENQLLNGSGTGTDLAGICGRLFNIERWLRQCRRADCHIQQRRQPAVAALDRRLRQRICQPDGPQPGQQPAGPFGQHLDVDCRKYRRPDHRHQHRHPLGELAAFNREYGL